jgi:hypothetical protein
MLDGVGFYPPRASKSAEQWHLLAFSRGRVVQKYRILLLSLLEEGGG